ncbi:MAG: c-type cytochrome [Pseudomonadales bacterium]|jgi:cytochrome c5|nr:c-type cytochrome [Pseudomonadales bacterium]
MRERSGVRRQHGRLIGLLLGVPLLLAACGDAGPPGASAQDAAPDVYRRYCYTCHASGAAGAPRVGDAQAWAPRAALGLEVLVDHSVAGIRPGMPAMGLCKQCSRADLEETVRWMVASSGGFPDVAEQTPPVVP